MKRIALISLVPAIAGAAAAQSNTVAGLNGRLTVIDTFSYQGRRGPAHPNGEVAFSMYNEMCNPGTVVIPWQAAMQPNHPKFGFLAVRADANRIVQISDWSYCKHAFTSTNYSGPCGSCVNPGTGSVMGINCADAYGVGNNNDRHWLGPASELDPWLGTWNPVGSYFDQGDPNVGPPQNNDGIRSPSYTGSDAVKNRVIIRESELLVAGSFYYGIHLMHQGEAVANRGDNLASRGFTPLWNGSTWSANNNGNGQIYGSVLQRWPGASVDSGGNGNDDGRFFVAVKTTSLGGGQYHYEYAVHNVDNHRGGATFRVPCAVGATATNFTFRDIDANALNEWTGQKVGNEVVFTAPANNPLNWNTIYNFGFDSNTGPGADFVRLDEARLGAGAPTVSVLSQVPGGQPLATVANVGTGCGGTGCTDNAFYESFGTFDLANSGLSMTLSGNNYAVGNGTGTYVAPTGSSTNLNLGDDTNTSIALPFALPILGGTTSTLWVCSNGFVSTANNGTSYQPSVGAVLSGAYCWYGAWFDLNPAATGSGDVYVDSSAAVVRVTWQNVYRYGTTSPNTFQLQFFPNGNVNVIWQTMNAGTTSIVGWTLGGTVADPGNRDISATRAAGWTVCGSGTPSLAHNASARPVIGTTINLVTTNIPAGSPFGAVLMSFTQAVPPIDLASYGMPGCFGYVQNGVSHLFFAPGATHSQPFTLPNDPTLSGLPVVSQGFTYSPPLTPLGVISSNGVVMIIGQI